LVTILDDLIVRYPSNASIFLFKYQLLASESEMPREQLLQILGHAARVNPQDLKIYPYQLIEYEKAANWAALHEVAGDWMKQDKSRRQLPAFRAIFGQQ
jgi:hypothetical protein